MFTILALSLCVLISPMKFIVYLNQKSRQGLRNTYSLIPYLVLKNGNLKITNMFSFFFQLYRYKAHLSHYFQKQNPAKSYISIILFKRPPKSVCHQRVVGFTSAAQPPARGTFRRGLLSQALFLCVF